MNFNVVFSFMGQVRWFSAHLIHLAWRWQKFLVWSCTLCVFSCFVRRLNLYLSVNEKIMSWRSWLFYVLGQRNSIYFYFILPLWINGPPFSTVPGLLPLKLTKYEILELHRFMLYFTFLLFDIGLVSLTPATKIWFENTLFRGLNRVFNQTIR